MKRLILILAMVVAATISYGQGKYKVSKVIYGTITESGIDMKTSYIPTNLYVSMVGKYVSVNDAYNSIYSQESEIKDETLSESVISAWDAVDEKNNKVRCYLVLYKKTKDFYFDVKFGSTIIFYQLEANNAPTQKL